MTIISAAKIAATLKTFFKSLISVENERFDVK